MTGLQLIRPEILCVTTAVVDFRGRLLLGRSRKGAHKRFFQTPGGRVEKNETPEIAALRETEEETGVVARLVSLVGTLDNVRDDRTLLGYVAAYVEGIPHVSDELDHVGFYTPREVRRLHQQGALTDATVELIAKLT